MTKNTLPSYYPLHLGPIPSKPAYITVGAGERECPALCIGVGAMAIRTGEMTLLNGAKRAGQVFAESDRLKPTDAILLGKVVQVLQRREGKRIETSDALTDVSGIGNCKTVGGGERHERGVPDGWKGTGGGRAGGGNDVDAAA